MVKSKNIPIKKLVLYLKDDMFANGQSANEQVFLLDIGGNGSDRLADRLRIDAHRAVNLKSTQISLRQTVQKSRLARAAKS